MVALDAQLAVLAAQCMLTLVCVSPPAAAAVVRSPNSNHGEDVGTFHRLHNSTIPAHGKELNPASRAQALNLSYAAFSALGTEHPRDQKTFQTRDSPLVGKINNLIDLLKELLSIAGGALPVRHYHGREKVIIDKRTFLQHAHPSRRGDKVEERRGHDGLVGTLAVVNASNVSDSNAFLYLEKDAPAFVASWDEASTFILVDASPSFSSFSSTDDSTVPVLLLCNASCVTFNCDSSSPQPLTLAPCNNSTGSAGEQVSQLFSYYVASDAVEPSCRDSETLDEANVAASMDGSNVNGSRPDLMDGKDTGETGKYNNAMLLFKPSLASATSQESTSTVTVTTTVTETGSTSSPAAAAVDIALTSASENCSQASTPVSSPSSAPTSAAMALNVEVESPSTTTANDSTFTSNAPSKTVGPAGGAVATSPSSGSEVSSSTTPASFIVDADRRGKGEDSF
jgi:hypothetical protein